MNSLLLTIILICQLRSLLILWHVGQILQVIRCKLSLLVIVSLLIGHLHSHLLSLSHRLTTIKPSHMVITLGLCRNTSPWNIFVLLLFRNTCIILDGGSSTHVKFGLCVLELLHLPRGLSLLMHGPFDFVLVLSLYFSHLSKVIHMVIFRRLRFAFLDFRE